MSRPDRLEAQRPDIGGRVRDSRLEAGAGAGAGARAGAGEQAQAQAQEQAQSDAVKFR